MKKSLLLSLAGAAAVALSAYAVMPRETGTAQEATNPQIAEAATSELPSSDITKGIKIERGFQKGAKPTNMTQLLAQKYVLTFQSARAGWGYDQGNGITITRLGTTDTVVLQGGWYFNWISLKAVPNFTEGTLFIPKQNLGIANSTQTCWFTAYTTTNGTSYTIDWDTPGVTFKFENDGTITCPDQGWSLSVQTTATGEFTKSYWAMAKKDMTTLYPANGTMTFKDGEYVNSVYSETEYTVPICSSQEGNILTVRNFWNRGTTISMIVNSNGSLSIPDNTVLEHGSTAKTGTSTYSAFPYYMRTATKVSAGSNGGTTVSWGTGIITSTSNTDKSATFGPFTVIGTNINGQRSHDGYCAGGTINLNTAINTSNQPFTGAGTAANPYKISNLTELQAFLNMASKTPCGGYYFKQTADIDLGGQQMTMNVIPEFSGSYDGGGFSLKGLNLISDEGLGTATVTTSMYQGLIQTITEFGIVKNLTLEGSAKITRQYNGVLCGTLFGTLENVTSKVNVENTYSYVGGLVGMADEGSKLTNCIYDGEYTINYTYCGGIAGFARRATFTNCGFTGKFISTETVRNYVGGICSAANPSDFIGCYSKGQLPNDSTGKYRAGIVAYVNVAASNTAYYGTYNFKNCVNESYLYGAGYLGGIIGDQNVTAANSATNYMYRSYTNIESCVNRGDIRVTATSSYVGGISSRYCHSTKIDNCKNYGNVTAFKSTYLGGIVGGNTASPLDSTRSYITNCINYGNFKSDADQTMNYYCGGLIGNPAQYTTISNCSNYGDMEWAYEFGGIIGYQSASAGDTIRGCVNYGNLSAIYSGQAGGIVGYCTPQGVVIDQCANFGDISAQSTIAGMESSVAKGYSGYAIGGIAGKARGTIINCLNAGTITGASRVGGIVGTTMNGTASNGSKIYNNLNTGKVIGKYKGEGDALVLSLDTVGAIVGCNQSLKTDAYVPDYNKEGNNYYTPNVLADYGQIPDTYKAKHPDAIEIGDAALVNNATVLNGDLTAAGLAASLQNGWSCYDKYCWPAPTAAQWNDLTKLWAAQVVAKGGDILPNVTTNLLLGKPAGVRWTSSVASLNIKGNDAIWSEAAYTGPLTLTATCGDYSKEVVLNVTKATGVETLDKDGKEVVSEMWINANGVKVARPMLKDGNIYIVIRKYSDGTAENIKVFN